MLMAQRYPLYFDGIVAGAPAMRTGHSNLATRSITVALNRIAPKGQDGPVPGGALSDGDRRAIIAKLLDVCDIRDGVKDGMIFDVTGCNFRPADLQCPAAKMEGCLSKEQVDAIQIGFASPIALILAKATWLICRLVMLLTAESFSLRQPNEFVYSFPPI